MDLYQALSDIANMGRNQINQEPANDEDINRLYMALTSGMASKGPKSVPGEVLPGMLEATQVAGSPVRSLTQANNVESTLNSAMDKKSVMDRYLGTIDSYGGVPVRPSMSIGPLKQIDNLTRKIK